MRPPQDPSRRLDAGIGGANPSLTTGLGDGRGPSWAVLVVRACGVGVWARVGAVLGGAAS